MNLKTAAKNFFYLILLKFYNDAYAILSNAIERKKYDEILKKTMPRDDGATKNNS